MLADLFYLYYLCFPMGDLPYVASFVNAKPYTINRLQKTLDYSCSCHLPFAVKLDRGTFKP